MNLKKIAVTTDTNSGMLPGTQELEGLFVLPMPFVVDGVSMLESVELSRDEFYEKLKSDMNITTSQPSTEEVSEFWKDILKEYDQIVHVPTSSRLSNSFATAKALANDFDGKVFVVDNRRISVSLKSSVYDAVRLRDQGKSAKEIVRALEESANDYRIYVSTESMQYLKKGGRISPAAAMIGSILKLRPVLSLKGEKLEKFAIPRTPQKAIACVKDALVQDFKTTFKEYAEKGQMRICFIYGENATDLSALKEQITALFPNVPVLFEDPLSLSVACHTGPGTIAVGCVRVLE